MGKKINSRRKTMTKKAYKAELAKQRSAWTCARPEGFRLTNRKAYSRADRKASVREYLFVERKTGRRLCI